MLDAEREGVIDHLDLKAFFGSGRWEGSGVLTARREKKQHGRYRSDETRERARNREFGMGKGLLSPRLQCFRGATKWRKKSFCKKIQFRGTVQKTAVQCGFRDHSVAGKEIESQHFRGVKITRVVHGDREVSGREREFPVSGFEFRAGGC